MAQAGMDRAVGAPEQPWFGGGGSVQRGLGICRISRTIVYGYVAGEASTIRRSSMSYPSGQADAPVLNFAYTGTHANKLSPVSAIRDGGTDIISYKWLGAGNSVEVTYNDPGTCLSDGTAADHYAGLD
ncbi:MAG: hypothetical protein RLZZ179_3196 [Verrucomicrobiota bacterium]|jgi:hypothetical protein